jgi:hypothetical protein
MKKANTAAVRTDAEEHQHKPIGKIETDLKEDFESRSYKALQTGKH